jgi:hypothetical protein
MELIDDAAKITAQGILGARKFANSKDGRMIGSHTPETVLVRAQRIGSHVGVAAVIFSVGDGVAIAKTIELFRINREHSAIVLKKRFDERTTWNFYGYGHPVWLPVRQFVHDSKEAADCLAAVLDATFAEDVTFWIHDAELVTLCAPI